MAQKNHTINLPELLQCAAQPDPMLSMLEWLCTQFMEAEVSQQLGAEKSERIDIAVATCLAGWIPGGASCISWCRRCDMAATYRFLLQSANAVRQR